MACFSIKIDGSCSGGGNGSTGSLQDAYDNSTYPEIVLSPAPGALAIRDNAVPLGTNLFEVQDSTGAVDYFSVDSTGATVTGKLTVTGLIDPTATVYDEQATCPAFAANKGTVWVRDDTPTTLIYTDDTGTDIPISSAVAPDLQEAYNNGANGIIGLSAIGPVEVRDNVVPLGTSLLSVSNSNGIGNYLSVSATETAAQTLRLRALSNQLTIQPGNIGPQYTVTATNPGANRVLTIPDPGADTEIVLAVAPQTLSNKALVADNVDFVDETDPTKSANLDLVGKTTGTAATLSFSGGDQVIVIPPGNTTLVDTSSVQTLSNKSLVANTTAIVDGTDATKQIQFSASGLNTGQTATFAVSGNTQVITVPTGNTTLVDTTSVQTLSNKSLVANNTAIIDGIDATKRIQFTASGLNAGQTSTFSVSGNSQSIAYPEGNYTVVGDTTTQTLTGKRLRADSTWFVDATDGTKRATFDISGKNANTASQLSFSGGAQTVTFPAGSFTVTGVATAQTLTNKTLTSPTINTPSISSPAFSGSGSSLSTTLANGGSTLNWYQTGTWSPTVAFNGSTVGITYLFSGGSFVRIGALVFIDAYIELTNKGAGPGNAGITNLPFTVNNQSQSVTTSISTNNITLPGTTNTFFFQTVKNATSIGLNAYQAGGSSVTPLTWANFANNSAFNFTALYHV